MSSKEEVLEKIKYLGLNNKKIPKTITKIGKIDFNISKNYDETEYKQYRYVNIKDIQIFLTLAHRKDPFAQKVKNASYLVKFLDTGNPENAEKNKIFINILKNTKLEKIQEIEKEQEILNKKLPFKLSYRNEYKWQIYYDVTNKKYFMLYPVYEKDAETFLYLLKKQLEDSEEQIFVPIINADYSSQYYTKEQFLDIQNYIQLLTGNWPKVYELLDKNGHMHIQITGNAKLTDNLESNYRNIISSKEEAMEMYKLLKALFIFQSKFPNYFKFEVNISKQGSLEFIWEDKELNYSKLSKFLDREYNEGIEKAQEIVQSLQEYEQKLKNVRSENSEIEIEYIEKEKEISTFLECKKTFFGKVKYFFKSNKKTKNKENTKKQKKEEEKDVQKIKSIKKKSKTNYNVDDLIEVYNFIDEHETTLKNLFLDLNAAILRNKNLKMKLENAKEFIQEIDKHKKSIFDFWKYSNKDEVSTLSSAEIQSVPTSTRVNSGFEFSQDIEKFGYELDKYQRSVLSQDMLDSLYILQTNLIEQLNKLKTKQLTNEDLTTLLNDIKEDFQNVKSKEQLDYDIFGSYENDQTKTITLGNRQIRENPRNIFSILNVTRTMKKSELLEALDNVIQNIDLALNKVKIMQDVPIYKALTEGELNTEFFNIFDINALNALQDVDNKTSSKEILYKFNLTTGTNAVLLSNSIFFNNDNNTLPYGADKGTKLIFDISRYEVEEINKKIIRKVIIEDEEDICSKIFIRSITIKEFNVNSRKDLEEIYNEKLKKAKEELNQLKESLRDNFEDEIKEKKEYLPLQEIKNIDFEEEDDNDNEDDEYLEDIDNLEDVEDAEDTEDNNGDVEELDFSKLLVDDDSDVEYNSLENLEKLEDENNEFVFGYGNLEEEQMQDKEDIIEHEEVVFEISNLLDIEPEEIENPYMQDIIDSDILKQEQEKEKTKAKTKKRISKKETSETNDTKEIKEKTKTTKTRKVTKKVSDAEDTETKKRSELPKSSKRSASRKKKNI